MRFILAALLASLFASVVGAQPTPPAIAARSWLLLDVTSGQVLASNQPDLKIEPASLTKLMTAYLAFTALREKRLTLEQRPPVSKAAWKAIGSRMFVDPAQPATVDELLHGMIIQSGNDASIVLAEALAGSESAFAEQMNQQAQRMGLTNTQFRNSTGLPDPEHYSTASDLATLASRLISEFPQMYGLYSQREYTFNNIRQPNRNRLLAIDPSVDGVKTGHTEGAGYCLIASARRSQPGAGFQRRLLSVVTGATSASARAIESQKLLNWGFQNFEAAKVFGKGQPVSTMVVWKATAPDVKAGLAQDLFITVPRGQARSLKAEVDRVAPLIAPIVKGQRVGTLRVRHGDKVMAERALIAYASVGEAGLLRRAWDTIRLWFEK
ncbi:MAG: D-alanyl-D-alanine carboxypeptidase family protein [Quisquiliibacterium sp.]